jgi:hypothetical protein
MWTLWHGCGDPNNLNKHPQEGWLFFPGCQGERSTPTRICSDLSARLLQRLTCPIVLLVTDIDSVIILWKSPCGLFFYISCKYGANALKRMLKCFSRGEAQVKVLFCLDFFSLEDMSYYRPFVIPLWTTVMIMSHQEFHYSDFSTEFPKWKCIEFSYYLKFGKTRPNNPLLFH